MAKTHTIDKNHMVETRYCVDFMDTGDIDTVHVWENINAGQKGERTVASEDMTAAEFEERFGVKPEH